MKFPYGTLMFSRMKFNRSAAFLIFNAQIEQTREDKQGSEFKQTLSVPVIILLRDRFCALALGYFKRFSHRRKDPFSLKLTLHTRQKPDASCSLGFPPRFCTGFVGVCLFIQKDHSIRRML